jgi:hypothetical protein
MEKKLHSKLANRLNDAMTVGELIKELSHYDDNMPVAFSYNYGDYWNTQVASPLTIVDTDYVEYSDYHKTLKVIDEDKIYDRDEDEDEDDVVRFERILVLKQYR